MDPFFQTPPQTGNRFHTDPTLRLALQWRLPDAVFQAASPALENMGRLAADTMPPLAEQAENNPPRHLPYDAWGRRVDRVEVDESWLELVRLGQRQGLVSLPHEDPYGVHTRIVQAGLINLYDPVSAVADCPLVMTDGATCLLKEHDPELAKQYVPRLTAREQAWTSGQWMTEREGGSDVGRSATIARPGDGGTWHLFGSKWFTSATTADMALALARPEGAGGGSRGLSLFLLELRQADGGWNGLTVRRLKDKLGTRALPTAELDLAGARAYRWGVGGWRAQAYRIAGRCPLLGGHRRVGRSRAFAGVGAGLCRQARGVRPVLGGSPDPSGMARPHRLGVRRHGGVESGNRLAVGTG